MLLEDDAESVDSKLYSHNKQMFLYVCFVAGGQY